MLTFPECPSTCLVLSLRDYLVRTGPLHHTDAIEMFIQLRKPHKSVSAQTPARWMTDIMETPRVDTSMFTQHITCSASASWLEKGTKTMFSGQISPPHTGNSITSSPLYWTAVEIL